MTEKRHQKTATGSADQLPVMLAPQYWTTSIYPAWLHPAAAVLLQCGNACDVPAQTQGLNIKSCVQ